ncbi:unnamed protein product, partial [Phaeothamnion confervicola]
MARPALGVALTLLLYRSAAFVAWPCPAVVQPRRQCLSLHVGKDGSPAEGAAKPLSDDALYAEMMSSEPGFLKSRLNPTKAREEAELALADVLEVDSEKVQGLADRIEGEGPATAALKNVEQFADVLNVNADDVRTWALKTTISKLMDSTAMPGARGTAIAPINNVAAAAATRGSGDGELRDAVFREEVGFRANSDEFKARLYMGYGVDFDAEGRLAEEDADGDGGELFDALAERSIRAAQQIEQELKEVGDEIGMAPDGAAVVCPRCGNPSDPAEVARWGQCGFCRADEISEPNADMSVRYARRGLPRGRAPPQIAAVPQFARSQFSSSASSFSSSSSSVAAAPAAGPPGRAMANRELSRPEIRADPPPLLLGAPLPPAQACRLDSDQDRRRRLKPPETPVKAPASVAADDSTSLATRPRPRPAVTLAAPAPPPQGGVAMDADVSSTAMPARAAPAPAPAPAVTTEERMAALEAQLAELHVAQQRTDREQRKLAALVAMLQGHLGIKPKVGTPAGAVAEA